MLEKSKILDHIEETRKIDKSDMLSMVADMPEMLSQARTLFRDLVLPKIKKVKAIVISGMGGSAIAGDIVSSLYLSKIGIPICVNRDYAIPAFVDQETLFFALSYSGNTDETLSAVKEASARSAKIICVTSGGELKELAEKNKYSLFLNPAGLQPRAALPYLLIPLLISLGKLGLVSEAEEDIEEAIKLLEKLKAEYDKDCPIRNNPVKQLASKIFNKIPIIFSSGGLTFAAGLRLKTQFNENSKLSSLFSVFPELDHNEIVSLSFLKRGEHDFFALLLRDEKDPEKLKKRMETTKSLIGRQVGGINEIWSQGRPPLARLMSLIYFADFLTVYLAVLRGIDPTPVDVITRLKKELSR